MERELGGNRAKPARALGKAAANSTDASPSSRRRSRLGIYAKARLLNRVKWQLNERGYSEPFVAVTVAELTAIVSRPAK